MTVDILALANQAAATAVNMTEASEGGAFTERELPAEGPALARLISYIETGKHEKSAGAGKPKQFKEQVILHFELSGPRHPPTQGSDGALHPHIIKIETNAAPGYGPLNAKASLYGLFTRMNWAGKATHLSQLLGSAFIVTVRHEAWRSDPNKKSATIRDVGEGAPYLISPPRQTDVLTGTVTEIPVPPPISPLRLFVWNAAPEIIGKMWDTLFIDGEYPERKNDKGEITAAAKSKNIFQNAIKAAVNFKDSPIAQYLGTGGQELKLGAAGNGAPTAATQAAPAQGPATPSTTSPSDPLAGVA